MYTLSQLTGYYQHTPPPKVDVKDFIRRLHTLRDSGFLFLKKMDIRDSRSYHTLVMRRNNKEVLVLFLHIHYPLIASVVFDQKKPVEALLTKVIFEFQEVPAFIAEEFGDDFQIQTKEYLDQPISENILAEFDKKMLKIIRQYQPDKLGDLIFNYWD